jgi:hypothetical protein
MYIQPLAAVTLAAFTDHKKANQYHRNTPFTRNAPKGHE